MSGSPSHYRREGRNAFARGVSPSDLNPYARSRGLTADLHSIDWLAGWQQAAEADEMAIKREEAAERDLDAKLERFAELYNLAKDRGLIT
jgi:hypothetical protein